MEISKGAQPGSIYQSIQNYPRATVLLTINIVISPLCETALMLEGWSLANVISERSWEKKPDIFPRKDW